MQGALRYDRAWSWFPADHNGAPQASRWNAAPISFPRTDGVTGYNDITPRGGFAYDLFGNGKTSLKVNAGKYLQSANNQENYTISNPALDGRTDDGAPTSRRGFTGVHRFRRRPRSGLQHARSGANGECILPLVNFGNPNALTIVNLDVLHGWGVRPCDWQWGVSVQQEIFTRTSLEVGYNRRWFNNFFVNDNINLSPSDFDRTTITAPTNSKLPDGGGYPGASCCPSLRRTRRSRTATRLPATTATGPTIGTVSMPR